MFSQHWMYRLGSPGEVPQGRARQGARAAVACTLAQALVFSPMPPSVRSWLPVGTCVLAPALAFLASSYARGEVAKLFLLISLTAPVLTGVGLVISYACYLVSGFTWQPWVLYASLPPSFFVLTIWSKAAALMQKPHACYVADPVLLWTASLVPVIMCNGGTAFRPVRVAVALLVNIEVAAFLVLLCSHLPGIGTLPANLHIPSLLAENLSKLADYIEALALRRDHTSTSLYRRREIRAEALRASANLRRERANAVHEGYREDPVLQRVIASAEKCRMGLQLKHFTQVSGLKGHPAAELMDALQYRGELGEARLDVAMAASTAMRASANLLSQCAGVQMVGEIPGVPEMGAGRVSSEECRTAGKQCCERLEKDMVIWREFHIHTFKERLEAFARRQSFDFEFLRQTSGESQLRTEEEVFFRRYLGDGLIFEELSRAATTHLSIQTVAEQAATIASVTADLKDGRVLSRRSYMCFTGGVGMHAFLTAPAAGWQVWHAALVESWRYGLRWAVSLSIAGVLGLSFSFWIRESNYGFWTVVTLGICLLPVQGAAVLKAVHRLCGTVAGAALGIASTLLAASSELTLWSHTPAIAFLLKFFDRELQYAGTTCFITYVIVEQAFVDEHESFGERFGWDWATYERVFRLAEFRVISVALGVLIAVFASVFVAPTRAVDVLRSLEQEALGSVADVARAASKTLACSAEVVQEAVRSRQGDTVAKKLVTCTPGRSHRVIHSRLVDLKEALFFGGDGLPAMGDMLSDARVEYRLGADRGVQICFGLLWLPNIFPSSRNRCRVAGTPVSTNRCLKVVPALSRLLRLSDILLSLLSPGVEEGCERLLGDPRVHAALGAEGAGLSTPMVMGIGVLAARSLRGERCLAETCAKAAPANGDGDHHEVSYEEAEEHERQTREFWGHSGIESEEDEAPCSSEESGSVSSGDSKRARTSAEYLEVARASLDLLTDGALASRKAAGGSMGPDGKAGGLRVAAILLLLREVLRSLDFVRRELEGDASPKDALTPAETPPPLDEDSIELVLRQEEEERGRTRGSLLSDASDGDGPGGARSVSPLGQPPRGAQAPPGGVELASPRASDGLPCGWPFRCV